MSDYNDQTDKRHHFADTVHVVVGRNGRRQAFSLGRQTCDQDVVGLTHGQYMSYVVTMDKMFNVHTHLPLSPSSITGTN